MQQRDKGFVFKKKKLLGKIFQIVERKMNILYREKY